MQSAIIYLTNLVDYKLAIDDMKEIAKNRYFKKGEEVLKANYKAIEEAKNYLNLIEIDKNIEEVNKVEDDSLYHQINIRKGDSLKTSDFLEVMDGHFTCNTASLDKRGVSDNVPEWLNENCIMCNQCSINCPHGVIRPFLLDEEEYNKAPEVIKEKCITPILPNLKNYKYVIGISALDCTGCGVCINNCPGKKGNKALAFKDLEESLKDKEQSCFDYLIANVSDKNISVNNVITSQFKTPKFAFSGA